MPELSLSDIQKDPEKYGVPTFEQFRKNPDKYRAVLSEQEQLGIIDNGGQNLKRYTKERVFKVLGQEFKSLERAESFCKNHGIPIKDWKVVTNNMGGQFGKETVIIMPPDEFDRRNR